MSYRGWTHLDLGVRLQTEPLGNGAAAFLNIPVSPRPESLPVLTGSGERP